MKIRKPIKNTYSNYFNSRCLSLLIVFVVGLHQINAQSDKDEILKVRNASNEAIKSFNFELSATFLTDDVLTTTGSGTLLKNKQELREYVRQFKESKTYFLRTSKEIKINIEKGLAWEYGVWNGHDKDRKDEIVVSGKYAAMWTKESGKWLIKSQLFVTLN